MTRNINKELFERQTTMFQHDEEYIGELTNERLTSASSYDQGMPLRSSFAVRRPKYDINSHLDFDLGEKIDTRTKIGYNDTNNEGFADLSEAMTTITRGVDPIDQCASIINSTGAIFNKQLFGLVPSGYVICSIGIVALFAGLYAAAHENLELEIKNYFGFHDKKHTNIGMLRILDSLQVDGIHLSNLILCDKHIQTDDTIKKHFKKYYDVVSFDKQQLKREENRINSLFPLGNFISSNTLEQTNVGLFVTCRVSPVWYYCPDYVYTEKMQTFIKYTKKTFAYFEDKDIQLIEIPLELSSNASKRSSENNNFVLGLINKRANDQDIDYGKLMYSINYLKPTTLNEVVFPLIKQRYKTRYVNMLKKTGMRYIFDETDLLSIFPNGTHINDLVQYVDLNFSPASANKTLKTSGQTLKKFCVKKNFEFYLRIRSLNIFLLRGAFG